jgi:hypothetical protein
METHRTNSAAMRVLSQKRENGDKINLLHDQRQGEQKA